MSLATNAIRRRRQDHAPLRHKLPAQYLCTLLVSVSWSSVFCLLANATDSDSEGVRFFRQRIEPVLKSQCYRCHSRDADEVQAGLRLDSRAAILRGGDSGPAIVAGDSRGSLLIQAIRHEGGLAMPPKKPKLPESTIADFVKWIDLGAPDPRGNPDESEATAAAFNEERKHWSFQPVHKAVPPQVTNESWLRSPVDAFVLSKLEERRWQPAPQATRADLIRRVSFDLIGLPPSPADTQEFVSDPRPDAYERLVDRLLNRPQYGERWAQHWLDTVRYAETEGYEYDRHIPDAWRYRDYVISSLNADKPFDRFVIEQIAGDEIAPNDPECQIASIFHRLGPVRRNAGNPDIALSRNEVLTERTDIIGAAFLGLTIGCARCHNHKLEPILQKDYYRLQAYLAATEEHNVVLAPEDQQRQWQVETKRMKDQIAVLEGKAKAATGTEKRELEEQIERLEDQLPPPLATIPATHNDFTKRTAIHVLRRGVWEHKGEPVGPRPLSVLIPDNVTELAADVTNPRTQLAQWLASREHPLTARVIANRLWQHHFGVGLVKTANDFGRHGDRPSHPELLDWLAATLVEHDWQWKPIHRLIVLSNAYQQSSRAAESNEATEESAHAPSTAESERFDPENRLLWKFSRRRLSAEEVRDAMLVVAGRINLKSGGTSVIPPVDPELVQLLYKPSQWTVTRDAREHDRRSVYLLAKRNLRLPFLESLDVPALLTSCARRESSTHAPQALELLNGSLANDLAQALAWRLEQEAGGDLDHTIDRGFWLTLGRAPRLDEQQLSRDFLRDQPLSEFALALFNLNEFLYVP